MRVSRGLITVAVLLLFAQASIAQVAQWKINPQQSYIRFIAIENNAPVEGEFKEYKGEIAFDPEQLDKSHVKLTINLSSVNTSYEAVADTLKGAEWFDIVKFPDAVFESTSFQLLGDKKYEAKGNLSLRDKTLPVTLHFTLDEYSTNHAQVSGEVQLLRVDFGVGQGSWAKTDSVKNEVTVKFQITANK